MADIGDGFYVTSLIGMGVNQVTGDYSRGASGFWIENGKPTYPVSEVTIAGNLVDDVREPHAGERPRVPLRRQCADRPRGGPHRCRPVIAPASATLLAAAVREAGALALKTFRSPVRQWTKGKSSPVSEADIAVDALLREKLGGAFPAYGWLSEETEDDPQRLAGRRGLDRRSDRRHARLSRRPRGLGGLGRARGRRPAAARRALCAGDRRILLRGGRRGRDLQRRSDPGPARNRARGHQARSVPSASSARSRNSIRRWCRCPGSARWRCGSPGSRRARSTSPSSSGNSHDWDLAAADLLVHEAGGALTDIDGERLVYNRPQPVHALLVAASRSRHGTALALIRERRAQFV